MLIVWVSFNKTFICFGRALRKEPQTILNFFFIFIRCSRSMQIKESQRMLNLSNKASNFKFLTRKWSIINDQSNTNYAVGNEIVYSTEVLRSLVTGVH